MKKNYLIIGGVIILILIIVGGFWFWRSRQAKEPTPTKEPEGTLIETTLAERPFVILTPTDDGHWLTIDVSRIKDADSLEYELLYNTESGATQGSINTVSLKGETTYSKKILLGSESSGRYKYDEGVTQGTLTIRLRGGPGTRKLVTDFHLQQGDDELTSIDEKFSLTGTLSQNDFYVTMMTIGLPGEFEGEILVGPYSVFTSGTETVKNGEVSLKLPDEVTGAKLSAWTGTEWQETEAEVKDKTISGEIDSLATFIVMAE
ncbi:MAG TPA: hypothetical protein VMY36_00530 [Patescibacteria group bacterium]|nr:hypothetical protein [Patescibacteria group bacterium]